MNNGNVKKKGKMSFTTMQMNLEGIMLSEVSQRKTTILLLCEI